MNLMKLLLVYMHVCLKFVDCTCVGACICAIPAYFMLVFS